MNPAQTHAVVVGIEKYDIGDAWDLNGPALDAVRFVRWLRTRGVPAENIGLFASPLAENKSEVDALDVRCQPADSKSITDALADDFAKRRGELLLVMWGGHGVIGAGTRRLFFSDVKENLYRNLDVSALLEFIRSSLMPGFSKHVIFLDACANYFELQQSQVDLADVRVPPGAPRAAVSQFILFAAGRGERAKNLSALRKGLFSSVLLEELEKSQEREFLPDLGVVQARVEQQFASLRAAGKAAQIPVHFFSHDWSGNEDVKYSSDEPDLAPAERDLAEALLDCPIMQTVSNRMKLLAELRAIGVQSVGQIFDIPDKRIHTEVIVSVLTRSGDIDTLISRVLERDEKGEHLKRLARVRLEIEQHLFDHSTTSRLRELLEPTQLNLQEVTRLYRECGRDLNIGERQESEHVYWLLMKLAGFPQQSNGFPYPALLFAEKIARIASPAVSAQLLDIVDVIALKKNTTREVREFRTGTKWQSPANATTLVFEMKPKAGGLALRASLLDSEGIWTALSTDDSPVSEAAARDKFRELVACAEQHATNLVIEMVVAREMLCWPVDRWEIDVGGFNAVVGAHYPVVLRWLDRLRNENLQRRWSVKWQSIRTLSSPPLWLRSTNQYQPGQLLAILGQAPDVGAFITFAFSPSRMAEPRGDALSVALSGGTPVAVWLRESDPDPDIAQRQLQELLTQRRVEDLPDILRIVRNQAEQKSDPNHPGCRIALLFDNHDHRPPQLAG